MTNIQIQKENERQANIHSKTFKITKELAQEIFLEKDVARKKEKTMNLLNNMTYQKSLQKIKEDLVKAQKAADIDKIVTNLYLAQSLCKVIK